MSYLLLVNKITRGAGNWLRTVRSILSFPPCLLVPMFATFGSPNASRKVSLLNCSLDANRRLPRSRANESKKGEWSGVDQQDEYGAARTRLRRFVRLLNEDNAAAAQRILIRRKTGLRNGNFSALCSAVAGRGGGRGKDAGER